MKSGKKFLYFTQCYFRGLGHDYNERMGIIWDFMPCYFRWVIHVLIKRYLISI